MVRPPLRPSTFSSGLLREDKSLAFRFLKPPGGYEAVRSRIDQHSEKRKALPTAVDLPLSNESKRVLKYAEEEADRLAHRHIGSEHLLLGLAREEKCFAAELLRDCGFNPQTLREEASKPPSATEKTRPTDPPYRVSPREYRSTVFVDTVELHGKPRNADYIRRSAKPFCEISWHWEKRAWAPRDVVIHRKTQRLSFDSVLAEDAKHFDLIKEGWTKDHCSICGWELFASKDAPDHATGYTNGRDWICTECYDKFITRSDFFSSNYPDIT